MITMSSIVVAISVAAGPTVSEAAPARLAIADFRGPHAGRIQGAAETGLMARYYVVPDFSVRRVAREQGLALESDSDFGAVGRTLAVAGFLSAQILPGRGGWQARLEVRRGDTGAPVGSFVLADRRLDGLESRVLRQAPARVHRLLARLPAPEPPADPVEPAATVVETAPAPAPQSRGRSDDRSDEPFAELSVEGRLFTRTFLYAQNLSGLPDYRLPRALSAALDLTLYPHALLGTRQLPPIGVAAALEYAPGLKSRAAGGDQALATQVNGYRLGLKYRLTFRHASLAPQVAYGRHGFQTGGEVAPDVRYQFLWLGSEGRWTAGRLAFFGSAAYLHGLAVGPLGEPDRFPRASAHGGALELGAALEVVRGLELRLTMGLRRFGLAMHARPGDALVAGGAVDQLTWAGVGVAYRPAVRP